MFLLTHHSQTDQILYFRIHSAIECLARSSKQALLFAIQLETGASSVCFSSEPLLFYNDKSVFCKFVSVSACFAWTGFIP